MRIRMIEHDTYAGGTNIDLWAEEQGHTVDRTFLCKNEIPPSVNEYDWLVLTGGFQHAWEEDKYDWLKPEKEYILEALQKEKVVVGLCFGAQLISEVLGGRVYTNQWPEIGWHTVALTTDGLASPLMESVPASFTTFHWHKDHFTLPPDCVCLAQNECTPHQAFISKKYKAVGFQFHSEYTKDLVEIYARDFGHEWQTSKHAQNRDQVLTQIADIPDTYWLAATLLDNIREIYGPTVKDV